MLKLDIIVETEGGICLMHAKWKSLHEKSILLNYDITQADAYQLCSYGAIYQHKFPDKKVRLFLICPRSDTFAKPLRFTFKEHHQLSLTVLPFDLDKAVGLDETFIESLSSEFQRTPITMA